MNDKPLIFTANNHKQLSIRDQDIVKRYTVIQEKTNNGLFNK